MFRVPALFTTLTTGCSSLFDQNRAYAALGLNIQPGWRFETAYMNQALLQRSGRVLELNHILMFSVLSNAPFPRK